MRVASLVLLAAACGSSDRETKVAATKAELGQMLFEDPALSEPAGQACLDCHHPAFAFADPEDDRTSAGVHRNRYGVRNTQMVMYSHLIPPLRRDDANRPIGGLFWDGRASSLDDQAVGPLLNPIEMNNPDKATVVKKVRATHAKSMRAVFGPDAFATTDAAFAYITDALATYQRSRVFAPFNSTYDRYLAGKVQLTDEQKRGLAIFEDPERGNCASCHPSRPGKDGAPPLFTTLGYGNLGLPKFADNPFYSLPKDLNPLGAEYVDRGLAATTADPSHEGMFRIPSLRNVGRTTPYGHNGYFRRLDDMVEFHVRRGPKLAPPEIAATVARPKIGDLSRDDILDLVAFLDTLTDADVLNAPPPPPE